MTVKEGTGVWSSPPWPLAFISSADKPAVMTGKASLEILVNFLLSHRLGSAGTRTSDSSRVPSLCNSGGDEDCKLLKSCMKSFTFCSILASPKDLQAQLINLFFFFFLSQSLNHCPVSKHALPVCLQRGPLLTDAPGAGSSQRELCP